MKKLVIAAASLVLAGCAGMSPDPQAPKVKITPLPLSGRTMEFDGSGRCTSGC